MSRARGLLVGSVVLIASACSSDPPVRTSPPPDVIVSYDVEVTYPSGLAADCRADGSSPSRIHSKGDDLWLDVGSDGTIDGIRIGAEVAIAIDIDGDGRGTWVSVHLGAPQMSFVGLLRSARDLRPVLGVPGKESFSPRTLIDAAEDREEAGHPSLTGERLSLRREGDRVVSVAREVDEPIEGLASRYELTLNDDDDVPDLPAVPDAPRIDSLPVGPMLLDRLDATAGCFGMTSERVPGLQRCLLAEAGESTLRQWLDDPRHSILWVVGASC